MADAVPFGDGVSRPRRKGLRDRSAKAQNGGMFDWNDLKYLLAVSREGSTLAAARTLKVNQTTVARRLEALEFALDSKLFERSQTGSRLTEVGQKLLPAAEAAETAAQSLENLAAAEKRGLSGVVRVATNESFANLAIMPVLGQFRALYPDLRVELMIGDKLVDLARGEADVAIRGVMSEISETLVGRKLFDTTWSAYCSRRYAEANGAPGGPEDLDGHAIIGAEGDLALAPPLVQFAAMAPNSPVNWRTNSLGNLVQAACADLGIAPLPDTVALAESQLVPCFSMGIFGASWILTTEELRHDRRVRAFIDFITPAIIHRAQRRLELGPASGLQFQA
jgi:DNA-binding transcriptional LysR family regulator